MCDHPRLVSTPRAGPNRQVERCVAPRSPHPAATRTPRRNPRTLSPAPREEPVSYDASDRSRSVERSTYALFHVTTRRRFHEHLFWTAASFDSLAKPGTQSERPKMCSFGDNTNCHRIKIPSPASPVASTPPRLSPPRPRCPPRNRSSEDHSEAEASECSADSSSAALIAPLVEIERPPLLFYATANHPSSKLQGESPVSPRPPPEQCSENSVQPSDEPSLRGRNRGSQGIGLRQPREVIALTNQHQNPRRRRSFNEQEARITVFSDLPREIVPPGVLNARRKSLFNASFFATVCEIILHRLSTARK